MIASQPRLIGYVPSGRTCPRGNEHLCIVTFQSTSAAEVVAPFLLPADTETTWCPCDPYTAGPFDTEGETKS